MNYEWNFPTLDVRYSVEIPAEDTTTLTNVVETVHWTYTAIEGDYTASMYGSVAVGSPDPATFTDYSEITKEQVTEWVEAVLNVEEMQANLASQIEAQKAPQTGGMAPPWN
jgi:acyl carrier protein